MDISSGMGKGKRKIGQSTSGIEKSVARRRKDKRRRRSEEAAWAARSGPVKIIRPPEQAG